MSKKISDLTAATTPLAGTELVEIVQGGTSKKVAASYLSGSGGGRELLSASRTYYVRTDGSDSNNGLANTSGGAFLTIQKAVDTVCNSIDIQGYNVIIQVGDGTYTTGFELKDISGNGIITIQGNSGTPANVVISTTSSDAIIVGHYSRGAWVVKDLKIQTTTSGNCLLLRRTSYLEYSNIVFGSCATSHIAVGASSVLICTGNYAISGGASVHLFAQYSGFINTGGRTVTITGTPAFSTAFAQSANGGQIAAGSMTFSGSATGVRYNAVSNGVIDTGGSGATYFPGNSAGTSATGGQYI